ncbi:DedA family protein [Streptomyces sp. NPDC092952]|uniref:DedA family protein n=1 Tax=Streptomyces sp. NPDC092952 TaxID=3366018 RepID=UPI0037FD84CA
MSGFSLASVPLAVNPLDAGSLLAAFGALGIAVVLFAETGLLVGFFLPGDSLLFTAGLLCVPGAHGPVHLSLPQVLAAAVAGALLGAQTGYWIGGRGGRALLTRSRSRRLHEGAARAEELLGRYGHARAIVLARFVPVVRTVLNPLAGALNVPAGVFTLWQAAGGVVWTVGLVLAGYALGSSVPNVDRYLLPIVALVVVVSLIPLAVELLRSRSRRAAGAEGENS